MSKAVDDRVVSLEFDNAQFEKSVNETLKMLEELKKSLKFDKAAENLSAITDAGKKVDLSTVGESVDKLNEKFSTMRLVGLMALSSIVDGAMQMAKKVASILMAPFNQIKTGGWARAMKIEDAKFMLEGLQVQWDKISKDINYGVADTAYGLDEAAKAASQLVASGVKFGETYGETGNSPMAKALRGISGVAAMTNSTYEEISSIFTTVAGQGKMMTMQLRQLESRGLNVAATMATQFNKVADGTSQASEKFQESVKKMTNGAKVNEAAIRDMIQKGKVDFAIFSEAMDEAFGQHAKDANNTFTGALANVKAALSKIGAEFATPLIQDAIPVLNAIRKMINAIKTSMSGSGGIFDLFRTMSRGISNIFTSKIERITDFLTNRFTGISNINRGLWLIMTNIVKIVKTIKTAFQNVFSGNTGDHVNRMAEGFEKLAWALTPTDAALKGFGDILTVVFSIIKKVGEAIGWLISKIGGPAIRGFARIVNVIFALIGKFGTLISTIFEFVKGFADANHSIQLLEDRFGITSEKAQRFYAILNKVKDVLKKVGEIAKTALKYLAIGVAAIVAAPIYLLYQGFLKLTQIDWSKFLNALKNAKALIVEFFTKLKESQVVQGALKGIETALGLVAGAIIYLGEKVVEFFTKLANGEITLDSIKEKLSNIPEAIKGVGDKIAGFFKRNKFFSPIVDGVKNMATQIWGFVKGIPGLLQALTPAKVMLITFSAAMVFLAVKANFVADAFVHIVDVMLKWFHWDRVANIKLNNFLKTVGSFTQAIIALTGSLYVLSKIPNLKETAIILGSFIAVLAGIGVIYTILNRLVADKNSKSLFWQFARDLTLMSLGVYLVTSALVKLNAIDLKDVMKKLGVLAIAIGGIMGIATLFDNPKWSLVGKNGLATLLSMVGYAIAIYAAATAIKKLDGVDLSGLKGKWPELLAILVGLALTAKAIAGIGLGIFAGALAIFLGFSYVTKQMEKYALSAADSTAKLIDVTNTIKNHLLTVGANIKQMFNGILEAFKEDFWGTFSAVFTKISAAALIIIGIILVLRKIIPAFVAVAKEGRYAKRAAKGFLTIAVAIAGLMLVAKFIADGMKDNPRAAENLMAVVGMISLLIVAVGAMAMLTGLGSGQYSAGSIKQIRRTFASIALVFLSMAALSAVIADMSPAQFNRTQKILKMTLITMGIMLALIAVMTLFSKGSKAGFGTFAGVTILFATMLGALALLMHMFDNMDDYSSLWKSIALITGIFVLMGGLFITISKIRYTAAPKTLWALIGGIIAIGGAIALFVKFMPDNNVIQKVAAISGAMVLVMTALILMTRSIMKFAKDTKYSVTTGGKTGIGSRGTIMITLLALAEMIAGIFAIAGALVLLGDRDAGKLLAQAGAITATLAALTIIAELLVGLSKKVKGDTGSLMSSLAVLAVLSIIFLFLGNVMAGISSLGQTADRMLAVSQTVVLVIFELGVIAVAMSKLAKDTALATPALLAIGVLTIIFAVLGTVMAYCSAIGQTADRMLAVSQTVVLVIAELSAISVGLGALVEAGGLGAAGALSIPVLIGLTYVFKELGTVMAECSALGQSADRMLAVSQTVVLVIGELGLIAIAISAINMSGALTNNASIKALAGMVAIFQMLGGVLVSISALPLSDTELKSKILTVNEVLWALIGTLTVISAISSGPLSLGGAAGVGALGALITELGGLVIVLKQIETLDNVKVSSGIEAITRALNGLLSCTGAVLGLSAAIIAFSIALITFGAGCLAAAAGVLAFGGAIALIVNTVANALTAISTGTDGLVTRIKNSLLDLKNNIIQSFTEMKDYVINNFQNFAMDIVKTIASQSIKTVLRSMGLEWGLAIVEGFRAGAEYHSPPVWLVKFFNECGVTINTEAQGITHWFDDTGYTWGTAITTAFQNRVEGYFGGANLKSMMSGAGFNLGSITGINMENGIMPSIGSIQNELMNTLNLASMVGNSLNLASQGYMTTQTMFMDQLNHEYNTLNRKLEASRENLAYWKKQGDQHEVDRLTKDVANYSNEMYKLKDKMDAVSGATKDATETMEDYTKGLGGAGSATKDFMSSLTDTLESQMNIFSKFEQKSAMSKEELLGNMRSQIEGMTNWAAQMADLATKGIDKGLYEKLAMMGPQGAEYVGAFASMTAEELQEANTLWAQSLVLPGQAAAMVSGSFNGIGTNVAKGYANGITGNTDLAVNATVDMTRQSSEAADEFNESHSPSRLYERKGMFIAQGLAQGIEKNQKRPIEAIETMCQAMVMKAEKILNKETFASFGVNIVDGLTEGLNDEEANKKLTSKIKAVSKSLQDTFKGPEEKGGNEIDSPSKVFYRYGKYIDEGLANGISDYTGKVVSSTENLSTSALDAMRYTVANIATMINDEMEDPVITPVLDLSNVQAGVRTLNSVLAGNAALAAGISEDGTLQNGKSRIGGTTFIQNNYSPKALSRAEIYRQTNNQFARFRQQMG